MYNETQNLFYCLKFAVLIQRQKVIANPDIVKEKGIHEEPNAKSYSNFYCGGGCSSCQKNFSHKDELELHIEYFHTRQNNSQSQSQ